MNSVQSHVISKTLEMNQHSARTSIAVDENKRISVGAKMMKSGHWTIYVISLHAEVHGAKVIDILYSVNDEPNHRRMICKSKQEKALLFQTQELSALPWDRECNQWRSHRFQFWITVEDSISCFAYQRVDSRMEDLWTAAVCKQFTDIEFLVGDQVFPAHKAIVAARSPVFDTMLTTDMLESKTNKVKIEDIEPAIFQVFLKFLYTGRLGRIADNHQLLLVADKYNVETLKNLCQISMSVLTNEELLNLMSELL